MAEIDWTARPTVRQVRKVVSDQEREWRRRDSALRWQGRLAKAPWYRLGLLLLLVNACGWLVWALTR